MRRKEFGFPEEFPCPICGELQEILPTKKKKPYFQCHPCGVQVFIRGKLGISRLLELKNNTDIWDKIKSTGITNSYNLIKLSQQIDLIYSELKKAEGNIFNWDSEKIEIRKSELLSILEKLTGAYDRELSVLSDSISNSDGEV